MTGAGAEPKGAGAEAGAGAKAEATGAVAGAGAGSEGASGWENGGRAGVAAELESWWGVVDNHEHNRWCW